MLALAVAVLFSAQASALTPLKPQVESAVCAWTANEIDWKLTLFSYSTADTPETPEIAMIDAGDASGVRKRILTQTEHVTLNPVTDSYEIKMADGDWSEDIRMRIEVASARGAKDRAKLIVSKRGAPSREVECQFVFMANANAKVDYNKVY